VQVLKILRKAFSLLELRYYQLFGWLFFAAIFSSYILQRCVAGRNFQGLGRRLGFLSDIDFGADRAGRDLVHASSVGEAQAATSSGWSSPGTSTG